MKKLCVGLVVVGIIVNIGAMERERKIIYKRDITGPAYRELNRIIDNVSPFDSTDWKAIFNILDTAPDLVNSYITSSKETLLEYALEEKNFAVAKILLQKYQADPFRVVNPGDKTPLQIARKLGNEKGAQEIIALLESYADESRQADTIVPKEDYGNESGQGF